MIATSQPLASAAGLRALMEGGNAVDAAITAAAVLNVVEPMMCGIGGDLFALYYEAETGTLHGLNATGRAGARSDAAKLRADGLTRMPGSGPLAVTVPGALDGWEELVSRFGTRPLGELLQPAIRHAEEGFPVSEVISVQWKQAEGQTRPPPGNGRRLPRGREARARTRGGLPLAGLREDPAQDRRDGHGRLLPGRDRAGPSTTSWSRRGAS